MIKRCVCGVSLLLFYCLHAYPFIEWEGVAYNDETVANLITVVTVTHPIPSVPNTCFLYATQKSLYFCGST